MTSLPWYSCLKWLTWMQSWRNTWRSLTMGWKKWQPTPVFFPEKSNGEKSLWVQSSVVTKRPTWLSDWAWALVTQLLSCAWLFVTPWTTPFQVLLLSTLSQTLLKFMSIESVMPTNHLIFCFSILLLPSIFPSIRFFYNESDHRIRWPKYQSFQLQGQSFQWIFWVDFILSTTLPILFTNSKIMKYSLRDC